MAEKKKKFDITSLLNTKSRGAAQVEELVQAIENAFDVVMLDVDDLTPCKDNFYSTDNIDELAAAIELSGCIEQNLVVKPEAHGKYEIIAGHRRRLAVLKLVQEGKEEYRKVPCHIKEESDKIKDRLSLIFTNATARQLTDWEKIRQVEELKEVLTEYKKALQKENKDKPKEEQKRIGRIREIIAQILDVSTTQVGRIEAISNNLSQDFKAELEKGNINISTAHEISKFDEDSQEVIYKKYEEKGELHIKDVREKKAEITDEQAEKAQEAIKDAIKDEVEVNHAVFKAKNDVAEVEKVLKKYFSRSFQSGKLDGGIHIYRFQADGIAIIYTATWENFLINYSDLAKIVVLMIESNQLSYDDTPEDVQEEETATATNEPKVTELKQKAAESKPKEEKIKPLPRQQNINDYQEDVPELQQKGLDFTTWIREKYEMEQYTMIQNEIRAVVALVPKIESSLTNALSVWVMDKTKEYQRYLQS